MSIRKRTFRAILLIASAVLLAGLIAVSGVAYNHFASEETLRLRFDMTLAAAGVEKGGSEYLKSLDLGKSRVTWVDKEGTVIYDSQSDAASMENHKSREEIALAMANGEGESSRYSETASEKTVYYARRLSDGSVLRLSITRASLLNFAFGVGRIAVIIFIAAVLAALFMAKNTSNRIAASLDGLDLEQPLKNETYEEIIPLLSRIEELNRENSRRFDEQAAAERGRREFTANVSHELKTPLHTIMGSAELIENGFVSENDMPRFIGRIRSEAARLVTLIEDIIRLSQLDEGADMPIETFDLMQIVYDNVETLREAADEAGVIVSAYGEPVKMTGVKRLMDEVVYNLCENAIKYNRRGGSVDVTVRETTDSITLKVADTGIGIPKEHHGRVFERFYRVDKSHSRESGGTGLGLSIVKHAVALHRGTLTLESEEGKGSTITAVFPK